MAKAVETRLSVFISAGNSENPKYEGFISALIDLLAANGLRARSINRTDYPAKSPLATISQILQECSGTIVVVFERKSFPLGTERRGTSKERKLRNVIFPTPWNQIEAAMSYQTGLPILVLAEQGFYREGLLEDNYDWYVQELEMNSESLQLKDVHNRVQQWCRSLEPAKSRSMSASKLDQDITIKDLIQLLTVKTFAQAAVGAGLIYSFGVACGRLLSHLP